MIGIGQHWFPIQYTEQNVHDVLIVHGRASQTIVSINLHLILITSEVDKLNSD